MSIKARLEKLESRRRNAGVGYVIELFDGETHEQAIECAGIKRRPGDSVVLLKRFYTSRPPNHSGLINAYREGKPLLPRQEPRAE